MEWSLWMQQDGAFGLNATRTDRHLGGFLAQEFAGAVDSGFMANFCPCGCGARVGFAKKGAARAALSMDKALANLHEVLRDIESDPELSGDTAFEDLPEFVRNGERIRGWLLDHIHGDARPGVTPDMLAIKRVKDEWVEAGNAFFAL